LGEPAEVADHAVGRPSNEMVLKPDSLTVGWHMAVLECPPDARHTRGYGRIGGVGRLRQSSHVRLPDSLRRGLDRVSLYVLNRSRRSESWSQTAGTVRFAEVRRVETGDAATRTGFSLPWTADPAFPRAIMRIRNS